MRAIRGRFLLRAGLGLLAVAVLLQLVPYGRDHTNPPVTEDAPWPDGRARELATAACYDCHSNQTRWPPQSYVAPFSWLVTRDVEQGRDELNFSTWDDDDGEADDAAEAVADGSMPPRRYVLVHPDAALSEEERQVLVAALEAMDRQRR
jgi:Haem-binding domain